MRHRGSQRLFVALRDTAGSRIRSGRQRLQPTAHGFSRRQIQKVTFRVYEPLIAAGLLYIIMVFILTRLMMIIERRINRHRLAPA